MNNEYTKELDAGVELYGTLLPYTPATRMQPAEGGYMEDFAVFVTLYVGRKEVKIDITDLLEEKDLDELNNELYESV